MNGVKKNLRTMSSESHLEEKNDHEKIDIKEENMYSPMTLDKSELTETNQSCHLLHDKKDSESLESVQNYAQRIKSFLGWESNLEEQEFEKQPVDGNSAQGSSNSPAECECVDEGDKIPEENLNCVNIVSNSEGNEKRNCENTKNCTKNDSNLNIVCADENTNTLIQKTEEAVIESKDNEKYEQFVIPNMEMDLGNNNLNDNRFDDKNDIVFNDSAETNKDLVDNTKTGTSPPQSASSKSNNTFISPKDLKMSDFLPDESTRDRKYFDINSDKNVANGIQPEDNKLGENQAYNTDASTAGGKEDTELDEPILMETVHYDHENDSSTDKNCEFEQSKYESSEKESKNLRLVEKEELDASYISNLKTDAEETNSDTTVVYAKDSTSDVDLSKEINESTNLETEFCKMNGSVSEGDSFLEKEQKENDTQSKDEDSSESRTNDFRNENNDEDDLRSEDSLDFDETFLLNNNLPKHYVKEIRRLSRDIVRNVVESARSSVHELYANKLENFDITAPSESLRNYDHPKDTQEFYFNNGEKVEENMSEFDRKFSFENNSEHKKHQIEEELDIEGKDTICGFGSFKPKWIQKYATPRAYLVLFSIIGVIHGCYYPYVVSIISTLEKRYAFKTKVSGTLLLADEITPLILGILVGYIGGKTHRPRMVALGMFLSAACCFVSGLPYLIYGASRHTSYFDDKYKAGPKFCESGLNSTLCNSDEQPPTLSVVGIFLLASFLKGFATLSYYVIGISYMDDIIKPKNTPMYLAIALALRLLGPLVGFLMSSGFLKYYEDPVYDPGFGPDDPRWIGAWWIGFFLQGILLVIFTIPIALFPRRLPSQKKIEKVAASTSEDGLKEIFRGLISALKRLGTNPVFIVLIINTTMKIFGHFGPAIMLPKYMENQFRLSASEASLFSGALTVLCIIVSTILGGFLIWKFRPRIKVLLAGMIITEIIVCVGYLILMIPRCQVPEMLHFGMDEEGLILDSACNRNCDCSTSTFTPFCGSDGQTLYFSPCYAGCTEEVTTPKTTKMNREFSNCSCVTQQQLGSTISEGFCPDENCRSQMVAYLIILFLVVTVANLFTVAATIILLRSVHPNDKSVALGTFETFICLFGFIPFPVAFGALVDSACLVWEKSCGETGNCWFYDMGKYGYLLHGASALFCSFSVVCLITLYFLSSRVRDLYMEEYEEEEPKYVDVKLDTVFGSVTKL